MSAERFQDFAQGVCHDSENGSAIRTCHHWRFDPYDTEAGLAGHFIRKRRLYQPCQQIGVRDFPKTSEVLLAVAPAALVRGPIPWLVHKQVRASWPGQVRGQFLATGGRAGGGYRLPRAGRVFRRAVKCAVTQSGCTRFVADASCPAPRGQFQVSGLVRLSHSWEASPLNPGINRYQSMGWRLASEWCILTQEALLVILKKRHPADAGTCEPPLLQAS